MFKSLIDFSVVYDVQVGIKQTLLRWQH